MEQQTPLMLTGEIVQLTRRLTLYNLTPKQRQWTAHMIKAADCMHEITNDIYQADVFIPQELQHLVNLDFENPIALLLTYSELFLMNQQHWGDDQSALMQRTYLLQLRKDVQALKELWDVP